jgi:stage V sporulation protein R
MSDLIYTGKDWNWDKIARVYDECEKVATEELKLDCFPNVIEVITFEQMLDAYSSVGMPVMYNHWSFGKSFEQNYERYRTGRMGLALEIVINSNPCINYLMEENTMTAQSLVIAHAAFGHNSFFRNNYLFKQWTQADSIIDYLLFAKKYVAECEEKYGHEEVEAILDAAHALQHHGVDRYKKPKYLSAAEEVARQKSRDEYYEQQIDELWNLAPRKPKKQRENVYAQFLPNGAEENLLYFLEKKSPILKAWQRELVRIVRKVSQYFYPQMQTKVANEGWASTVHYYIMNRLFEKGMIDHGAMLEFLDLHCAVVNQPAYNSPHYSGFNPYHLGFSIFKDLKRMSETPTAEDLEYFPDFAGKNWLDNWHYAYQNFRDDSLIQQFLSPKLIREMRLFGIHDDTENQYSYLVDNIHDERGYRGVRNTLAEQYNVARRLPDIQVTAVDFETRTVVLTYYSDDYSLLDTDSAWSTLCCFYSLWGFQVNLQTRLRSNNEFLDEIVVGD